MATIAVQVLSLEDYFPPFIRILGCLEFLLNIYSRGIASFYSFSHPSSLCDQHIFLAPSAILSYQYAVKFHLDRKTGYFFSQLKCFHHDVIVWKSLGPRDFRLLQHSNHKYISREFWDSHIGLAKKFIRVFLTVLQKTRTKFLANPRETSPHVFNPEHAELTVTFFFLKKSSYHNLPKMMIGQCDLEMTVNFVSLNEIRVPQVWKWHCH